MVDAGITVSIGTKTTEFGWTVRKLHWFPEPSLAAPSVVLHTDKLCLVHFPELGVFMFCLPFWYFVWVCFDLTRYRAHSLMSPQPLFYYFCGCDFTLGEQSGYPWLWRYFVYIFIANKAAANTVIRSFSFLQYSFGCIPARVSPGETFPWPIMPCATVFSKSVFLVSVAIRWQSVFHGDPYGFRSLEVAGPSGFRSARPPYLPLPCCVALFLLAIPSCYPEAQALSQ